MSDKIPKCVGGKGFLGFRGQTEGTLDWSKWFPKISFASQSTMEIGN